MVPQDNDPTIAPWVIASGSSVQQALRQINSLTKPPLNLFVTDGDDRLLGSLTDGDIRRGLINGIALSDTVDSIMRRDCLTLNKKGDKIETIATARQRGIELLPTVDANRRLTGLVNLREINTLLPIEAVLMAGGRGERLRPLTDNCPKPLLEVGGKPIIDHNVEKLRQCGISRIYVTVNYLHEQIEKHFDGQNDISCILEPSPLGTLGSVSLIDSFAEDNVLIMNSDLLTSVDIEKMYLHHIRTGAVITVGVIPYSVSVPYAILNTDNDRVTGLEEKPTFNYLANAGVYMIKADCLRTLPRGFRMDAPDFIRAVIESGKKVSHYPIDGTWIDIGNPVDYKLACDKMK